MSIINTIFDLIKKSADDAKLNAAIKASKNFRDLAGRLVLWALPLIIAYGMKRLEAGFSAKAKA